MKYQAAYRTKFDAGHRYTVIVSWEREGFPETDLVEAERIQQHIDALVRELAGRDLAKMLGPHHPSAYGIADFFYGRLGILAPITRIEVRESDGPIGIRIADDL